jgi:mono/diheme cytochrome c family protein
MARWAQGGVRGWRVMVATGMSMLLLAAYGVAPVQGGVPPKSVWEGIYTDAQAERGKASYEQQCSFCHLSDLSGQGFAPPLVDDAFTQRWTDGNVGDLFTIVKVTMPQDKPQSLKDVEYADIVAHILKSNKFPAGAQELPADPAALKDVSFKK